MELRKNWPSCASACLLRAHTSPPVQTASPATREIAGRGTARARLLLCQRRAEQSRIGLVVRAALAQSRMQSARRSPSPAAGRNGRGSWGVRQHRSVRNETRAAVTMAGQRPMQYRGHLCAQGLYALQAPCPVVQRAARRLTSTIARKVISLASSAAFWTPHEAQTSVPCTLWQYVSVTDTCSGTSLLSRVPGVLMRAHLALAWRRCTHSHSWLNRLHSNF